MSLQSIRFQPSQYFLKNWSLIKVTGCDRESFFQGQVTNDLMEIKINQGQITARLDRKGKLKSFFFIAKKETHLLILCPSELVIKIKDDFEQYIIMDDVQLDLVNKPLWLQFSSLTDLNIQDEESFDFNYYGLMSRLTSFENSNLAKTNELELEEIRILNGWPKWKQDIDESFYINESYLNEVAVSYKKGCFLGQETVAKIENNRGAAYYPVLLKLEKEIDLTAFLKTDFKIQNSLETRKGGRFNYQIGQFLQVSLFRDYRVIGKKIILKLDDLTLEATVCELPMYNNSTTELTALELYHMAIDIFQKGNSTEALEYLKRAIAFNPKLADSYEALGVILGRLEQFEEAIKWMDKLLEVNPQSVMGHTNKSLFLMRLGKIEEAEAEKSLATVKSFAFFGKESLLKKQLEDDEKKKVEENIRRENMFLKVLDIDDLDTIALFGLADIFFQRKNFSKAIINLEKVITLDSKYSMAYLLLGKCYEAESKIELAISIFKNGIEIASQRGDMMPANEMQSRLNQLIMGSGIV